MQYSILTRPFQSKCEIFRLGSKVRLVRSQLCAARRRRRARGFKTSPPCSELLHEAVDETLIRVLVTQVSVTSGGLENVKNEYVALTVDLLVETVGNDNGSRFFNDTKVIYAPDDTGILDGVTLGYTGMITTTLTLLQVMQRYDSTSTISFIKKTMDQIFSTEETI